MPLFLIPVLGVLGIGIAMIRRYAKASADPISEDLSAQLLRWAVGLLSAQRAEWGQAMLGELGHLDGRVRRLRFAAGSTGAALVLPPWGRAAAGVWAMIALGIGSIGLYVGVAVHYRLAGGEWIEAGILAIVVIGFLLAASALARRPGVALPGLLGGLFAAVVSRTLSGFTFLDQILPDIVQWHHVVVLAVVPFCIGAAGTLYRRDPAIGKRIARLAALSAGLALYVYSTLAVAVIGTGGPFNDESGGTIRGTVSDRLGNNLIVLLVTVMITATVGWGGAAATGAIATRLRPNTAVPAAPAPAMSTAPAIEQPAKVRTRRRTLILVLLGCLVLAGMLLAATTGLRG